MNPSAAGCVVEVVVGVAFLCAAFVARVRGALPVEVGIDTAVGFAAVVDAASFFTEGPTRVALWVAAGVALVVASSFLIAKLRRRYTTESGRSEP